MIVNLMPPITWTIVDAHSIVIASHAASLIVAPAAVIAIKMIITGDASLFCATKAPLLATIIFHPFLSNWMMIPVNNQSRHAHQEATILCLSQKPLDLTVGLGAPIWIKTQPTQKIMMTMNIIASPLFHKTTQTNPHKNPPSAKNPYQSLNQIIMPTMNHVLAKSLQQTCYQILMFTTIPIQKVNIIVIGTTPNLTNNPLHNWYTTILLVSIAWK